MTQAKFVRFFHSAWQISMNYVCNLQDLIATVAILFHKISEES